MYREIMDNIREVASDAVVLKVLNRLYADRLDRCNWNTQDRKHFLEAIMVCAEDGMLSVVEGGMDCDCVKYEGHVSYIPATVAAVEKHIESLYEYAEGPIHWEIMKPSQAVRVKSTSHDLIMEAFENGHPHIVYC
jgi:hypothetical protein